MKADRNVEGRLEGLRWAIVDGAGKLVSDTVYGDCTYDAPWLFDTRDMARCEAGFLRRRPSADGQSFSAVRVRVTVEVV
ncbi:MAG: hypothetical protein ACRC1H_19540 [Caldilineaceae bacterium]